MERELKAARAKANQHKFGTPEWEAAMIKVRALVERIQANSVQTYASKDGDVWSV
jgi:hypothetical protein